MFRNECPFCGCSDCRNNGLYGERFSYSKEDYCSIYNCRKRLKCLEKKYCSDHTKKCPNSNCRKEISIFDEYCSDHGRRCKYCHSNIVATYDNYCSQCLSEKRKGCNQNGCNGITTITNEYCDLHERHGCRFDNCSATVIGKANYYCYNHEECCRNCNSRTSRHQHYCSNHWYECQQQGCSERISRSNNYCSQHIHNAFDKERNEKNDLKVKLDVEESKVEYLKDQLKMLYVDEEQFEAWMEENYVPKFGR